MFRQSLIQRLQFQFARLVLFALVLIIVLLMRAGPQRSLAAMRASLTFEDRVAAQRAIEEVYWLHRIWPRDNPQPKPALNQVLPEATLRAKVREYLQLSRALELFAERSLTPEQLQDEMERMARQTRMPAMLGELWAALSHDPLLAAECLARPALAERELRRWFEEREAKSTIRGVGEASALRDPQSSTLHPRSFDEWWSGVRGTLGVEMDVTRWAYRLPEIAAVVAPCGNDSWVVTGTTGAPSARRGHSAVWTGSEMIIWGGISGSTFLNTGGRYNPATDSWTANISTGGAPSVRRYHSAVWTGSEMIVWGGDGGGFLNTGGRYNPATDSWTSNITTNGAPSARTSHTAVWTGSEMIVWGGIGGVGGRYNPATDSWTSNITTTDAPSARFAHTAVWTGSEMIIWGGTNGVSFFNTGGRYNPATDSWAANTTTTGAPNERALHTAVWTGSEMIIWGGTIISSFFNTGGRYNPATNSWTANTITTGAPSARDGHTAVWTGSEMIIWGSANDSGGRYSLNMLTTSSPTQSFTSTGGPGSVAVTAQGGCTWTAMSNASFITITSGGSGAGNGTVNFTVAVNTSSSARTGTLTIGPQSLTVLQAGTNVVSSVSAASFLGAELAPESIVAAFGTGLSTQTVVATDADPNTPGIQLPTELAGTTVEVKDSTGTTRRAPLFFVSPTQVNYLMPSLTAPGACVVTIKSGDGKIAVGTVQAASVAPGLFTASASGQGVAAGVALRVRANGMQVFEPIAEFDPAQNKFVAKPIDLGPEGDQVFLILYGGGFRFRSALSTVSVKIGGPEMEVLYAAEAPGFIGLDQLNVRLARSLMGRGEVDVMLTVNGKTANTVKVAIK